jgi:hypothetical protein
MKGKIMDKKILLSGAAALLLVGGNMTAPVNASALSLSIGGETSVSATMTDKCGDANQDDDVLATFFDTLHDDYDTGGDAVTTTSAGTIKTTVDAIMDDINTDVVAAADLTTSTAFSYLDNGCGGASEDNPVLGWSKELSLGASGTLANGLSVSWSNTLDLTDLNAEQGKNSVTFGGAFGTLKIADGAPNAVTAALVGDSSGRAVAGFNDWEGHTTSAKTAGNGGTGLLYTAPSMGGMDLMVSWAPNASDSGLDDANYQDTFGLGLQFAAGDITIGGGIQSASAESACAAGGTIVAAGSTAQAAYDMIFKGDIACGDQTATAIGAEFAAGGIDLGASWSNRDTDEGDVTTMNVGMSTSFGDYGLSMDWTNTVKEYALENVEDEQTIIGATLSTDLGDGVGLGLSFSSNDVSLASEENGGGHAGELNNYRAQAKITVAF